MNFIETHEQFRERKVRERLEAVHAGKSPYGRYGENDPYSEGDHRLGEVEGCPSCRLIREITQ